MKLRTLTVISSLLLAACSVNNYQATKPSASEKDIEIAKESLAHIPNLTVTDEGYIEYIKSLPGGSGYFWKTTTINKISKEWSCQHAYKFLERGFVTRMFFKGQGGREEYFDKARCDAEETN
ncbi:hypothetical protein [Vibrio penaeicida]|uniref:Lipoprotein n=1 Tax=Vibrio penaeicida TaxID=104609 RepID=A0AAV5NNF3_9VIBR|nr:hypothetical protein [Vibrio penaeicida]RTZ20341.1 hypothetical protein EKN09_24355 [Vibrio penaeicida]GLQ71975.1 hypothetical protein GCM10007932_13350 [Vibrio penaeicida]